MWDEKQKYIDKFKRKKARYKVGTKVRICKDKCSFNRGYNVRWTDEVFITSKILTHMPIPMYVLSSFDETEENIGNFYRFDVVPVDEDPEYQIDSVLKESRDGKSSFVKWKVDVECKRPSN